MTIIAVVLALAAAEVPAPRTVNDQTIGTAKEFTTDGPSRVCMNDVMVTALPHESITLNYSGIPTGIVRLNRGTSWVDAAVGNLFVQPPQRGDVVSRGTDFFIADTNDNAELRYGLYAPPDDFHDHYYLHVQITGPGLSGDDADRSILRRVELRSDQSPPCDVTYRFGWDVLLGEKPLAVRDKH